MAVSTSIRQKLHTTTRRGNQKASVSSFVRALRSERTNDKGVQPLGRNINCGETEGGLSLRLCPALHATAFHFLSYTSRYPFFCFLLSIHVSILYSILSFIRSLVCASLSFSPSVFISPSSPFFPYFLPFPPHVLISVLPSVLCTFRSLPPCMFFTSSLLMQNKNCDADDAKDALGGSETPLTDQHVTVTYGDSLLK